MIQNWDISAIFFNVSLVRIRIDPDPLDIGTYAWETLFKHIFIDFQSFRHFATSKCTDNTRRFFYNLTSHLDVWFHMYLERSVVYCFLMLFLTQKIC